MGYRDKKNVYKISDYETVNDMYKAYGGDIVDRLVVEPSMYISKQIVDMFPNAAEILTTIWNSTIQHLLDFAKTIPGYIWENFWGWFKKVLMDTIKEDIDESTPTMMKGWF